MIANSQTLRLAVIASVLQMLLLVVTIAATHGVFYRMTAPKTTDYASFYAAGALADQGHAMAAYDRAKHYEAEQQATAKGVNYQYYFNPPTFTLLMAPLAHLPYLPSFVLFEGATALAWLILGTRVAGAGIAGTWCLLAVPSFWWVLGLGQNGFLTASLMAGGTLLLRRRPFAAGLVLGILCFKPHYGLLLPVVLLAARQWRAICGAALSVTLMVAATILWFGVPVWHGFWAMVQSSPEAMHNGILAGAHIDLRGALAFSGASPLLGTAIYGFASAAVIGGAAWIWLRRIDEVAYSALASGALILAPFSLFYDLVLASLAAAWLARAARQTGFLAGEREILIVSILFNFAQYPLAVLPGLRVSTGALVPLMLFGLALRRHFNEIRYQNDIPAR